MNLATQHTQIPAFEIYNMIDRIDPEDRKAEQERVEAARKEAEAKWLDLLTWPTPEMLGVEVSA